MIDKPTMQQHVELAKCIHDAEDALSKLLSRHNTRFFYAKETDRLLKSYHAGLGRLKSRLEDTMFKSYPDLSNNWTRLYYGDHDDVDELRALLPDGAERYVDGLDLAVRCELMAEECERLARSVERSSFPAGQAVYNAEANLSDAATMLRRAALND